MIYAQVTLEPHGGLHVCNITGHTQLDKNSRYSTACALVSLTAKTAGSLLQESSFVNVVGSAKKIGNFTLEVKDVREEGFQFYWTVSQFFLRSLKEIEKEFQQEIKLKID